jgi:uncharacterized protein (TIGR02452 family)
MENKSKDELIKIFENTKSIIENKEIETTPESYKFGVNQFFKMGYHPSGVVKDEPVEIIVDGIDTVSAIVKYERFDNSVCVLNMASSRKAGGGVRNGSRAQEECLFRCSNLFETVLQEEYPLLEDDAIYTQVASFFKDVNYNRMDEVISDVITIPAINLNKMMKDGQEVYTDEEYRKETRRRIIAMLSEARENFVDVLILGAWGCGVFGNDPETMATIFKEVIEERDGFYSKWFEKIVFAVINDHNSVDNNYEIFKRILG